MVFPPTHWFQGLGGRRARLSDIEFLAKKEFDGKLRQNDGTRASSVTGDLATLTANTGKDMYLAKAKISAIMENSTSADLDVELKVNGVIKATWSARLDVTDAPITNYEFAVTGLKVAATQIIKIEVITINTGMEVNGELVCFEEDTGVDPTI